MPKSSAFFPPHFVLEFQGLGCAALLLISLSGFTSLESAVVT